VPEPPKYKDLDFIRSASEMEKTKTTFLPPLAVVADSVVVRGKPILERKALK
jgi:hypothetical protein